MVIDGFKMFQQNWELGTYDLRLVYVNEPQVKIMFFKTPPCQNHFLRLGCFFTTNPIGFNAIGNLLLRWVKNTG